MLFVGKTQFGISTKLGKSPVIMMTYPIVVVVFVLVGVLGISKLFLFYVVERRVVIWSSSKIIWALSSVMVVTITPIFPNVVLHLGISSFMVVIAAIFPSIIRHLVEDFVDEGVIVGVMGSG